MAPHSWSVGCGTLAVVSRVVYIVAEQSDAATSTSTSDTISWGKIVFGVLLLLLAGRNWRNRPAPGARAGDAEVDGGFDTLSPGKAFGLAVLMAGVNPKNLLLTVAAAAGLGTARVVDERRRRLDDRVRRCREPDDRGSGRYYFLGGDAAKAELDSLKGWLAVHNAAVTAVLFVVFGVDLIAKGLPPLSG